MANTFKEVAPYKSQFGNALNQLTDQVVNRQPFTYDPSTDVSYQALAKQYNRMGDRARQNTLGDYAANTGGNISSYAVSAAAQAQNDYNIQLSNQIPALMQAAYDRYQGEYNMNLNALNAIGARDDAMYGRYADDRDYRRGVYEYDNDLNYRRERDRVSDSQWQKTFDRNALESDRDFDYRRTRDQRADYESDRNYNYQVRRDNVGDRQWEKQFNYNQSIDARDYAYQKARDKVADSQWKKGYNLDLRGVKLDENKFAWSKQQGNSGSGGGSGRSGGGRSYSGGSGNGNNNSKKQQQKQTEPEKQTVTKVGKTTKETSDSYAMNEQTKVAAKKAAKEEKKTNTLQEYYTFVSGGMLNPPKPHKLVSRLRNKVKK